MQVPYPLMLCDIGGTNARFALVETPGAEVAVLAHQATGEHPTFEQAAQAVFPSLPHKPRSIFVCAAGPSVGRTITLTNAKWTIEGPRVLTILGLEQGLLFNDFEAQALSIPTLTPSEFHGIGPDLPARAGTKMIHGPGTGLGTGALLDIGGRFVSVPSEAGHIDFAPVTDEQRAFWPFVEPVQGRITAEALISGPGLERLHHARLLASGRASTRLGAPGIVSRALADFDSEEAQTIRVFWSLVARYAGDMALVFVATGGVILSGGILPRITKLCDEAAFRQTFEHKAPYETLVRSIPTHLLIAPDTVLKGMAAVAAKPDNYVIDYRGRAWAEPERLGRV